MPLVNCWRSPAILALAAALGLLSRAAKAGRPLTVDDAEPVAPGFLEVEAGTTFFKNGSSRHWHFPVGLAAGVWPGCEISVATGGQLREQDDEFSHDRAFSGVHDLVLGSKVKLPFPAKWPLQHALAGAVKFPTGHRREGLSSGEFDFDLTWILFAPVGDKSSIHFNGGFTWSGNPPDERLSDLAHYGLAFDYQLSKRCQLVAEVYADTPVNPGDETVVLANGGLRWQLTSSLSLDTAVGFGVHGESPDLFATIGVTWTFGFPRRIKP